MRVAFNALFLQEPHTGTGRYVFNLLQSLGRVDGVTDYLVMSPHEPPIKPETPSTFHWLTVPVGKLERGGDNVEKVVWEQFTFPSAAKKADASVMHVPYFASPLRTHRIPTVVTIHDVINLRLPAYRATAGAQTYSRVVARAARHATLILAVSEHAKAEIIELLGVKESQVHVVREAAAPQYRPVGDPARLSAVRAKYGVGERFVLTTGIDLRKNVPKLIGAFAAVYHALGDPDLRLFVVGDPRRLGTSPLFPDWRPVAATFGIAEQVLCAPVGEDDLPALYSAADCFAFASMYEGFGLTPLEAMACGAPVVCSDRTSLPEVVGTAGILVNPDDLDRFGAAIQRVLTMPQLAADLRARGLARVKQFTWDRAAVETSALYAEVAGMKRD